VRFLQALQVAPDQAAAPLLPGAARANRAIFFDSGQPRSLSEVHQLLAGRLAGGSHLAGGRTSDGSQGAGIRPSVTDAGSAVLRGGLSSAGANRQAEGAAQMARLAYLLLADMGA
jgi:hypothetical protein